MRRGDTEFSPERLGKTLRRAWTRRLPGRLTYRRAHRQDLLGHATPRGAQGAAPGLATTGRRLLWARGGAVGALDQRTGRPLWTRSIEDDVFLCSPPTADAGVVFVGCHGQPESGLHALAAADGTPLWETGQRVETAPALAGDRVVTMGDACGDGAAHDRRTGALLWRSESICERFGRTPVVYAGRAYLGDLLPATTRTPSSTSSPARRWDDS